MEHGVSRRRLLAENRRDARINVLAEWLVMIHCFEHANGGWMRHIRLRNRHAPLALFDERMTATRNRLSARICRAPILKCVAVRSCSRERDSSRSHLDSGRSMLLDW